MLFFYLQINVIYTPMEALYNWKIMKPIQVSIFKQYCNTTMQIFHK